jgi:ATP-binding cassette subfamily F protein uup
MILLSAHQIEKSYDHKTLFEKVSLGIEERERIGFVGPNGAGKSTLLKILAGEIEADGGTVSRKKGLRIGFLEQTPEFPPGATILDQILSKCTDRDESLAQAMELMSRLELWAFGEDGLVESLSGGWKKRVALARELAFEPELLLLDEPTNHLDVSSVLWLEEYLRMAPFAVMMVTHDRLFLQRVATRILDLDPRNPNYLLNTAGDYSQYLETKELELAALKRHEQVEKNRLRRETEWLRRGSIARQTKQSARINAAGDLKDTVDDLKRKNQERVVDMTFGEAERSPKKLIEAVGITKRYDSPLFENLDILISPKTRLGLMGDNGCGKSTLIRILLGLEKPDAGTVKMADGIEVAYFEQSRETLQPELSVLKNICEAGDYVFFQGQSVHVRSYLDRFYFSGHKVELPVRKLSGGEQARLRLAQLMLKQSQILVLDEPTNDLDTNMLDSLETSLADYHGAVILVTHDRYFLDAVSNQILAFPPPDFADRKLVKFANYFQWENWFKEERSKPVRKTKAAKEEPTPAAVPEKKTKLTFSEKFELEKMEGVVLQMEKELEALRLESELPDLANDRKRMAEVHTKLAQLQEALDKKYERWTDLDSRKG